MPLWESEELRQTVRGMARLAAQQTLLNACGLNNDQIRADILAGARQAIRELERLSPYAAEETMAKFMEILDEFIPPGGFPKN